MTKEDEKKFDDMTWELQVQASKIAIFMMENHLKALTMSCGVNHVLMLQEEIPEHGRDEKRIANGE